jgi:glycosyltransferase involved in cell wall biosynthesis
LIVPSLAYEVSPLVVIEAFSQRTPALVRARGGLAEPVTDSGAGAAYATDAELLAAMDRLLDEPGHRQALGERGYAAYEACWTPDAHLARYLALIEEIAVTRREREGAGVRS